MTTKPGVFKEFLRDPWGVPFEDFLRIFLKDVRKILTKFLIKFSRYSIFEGFLKDI